jgi:hypothetical protein
MFKPSSEWYVIGFIDALPEAEEDMTDNLFLSPIK